MIFKNNGGMKRIDRVIRNTNEDINRRIEQETEARVRYLSLRRASEIDERIAELDEEWDIERAIELNVGAFALGGVLLAAVHDKKWLLLSGIVTAFLVQHSVQGWCPPVPLFRRMGFRTRREIEKEKSALKVLRGDFNNIDNEKDDLKRADKVLKAVTME